MRRLLALAVLTLAGGLFAETAWAALEEPCAPAAVPLGDERRALAARVLPGPHVPAFERPGGPVLERFAAVNVNGVDTVFAVLAVVRAPDCRAAWLHVQLPVRPNGATGFVRARDVALYPVRTRLLIDLSERRVELFRDGERVLAAPAAIGSPATPTPTGRFYVNQRLRSGDPAGSFGPGAVGISAFSPVLTGWAQGGPIAVHGTNRPDLVGEAASNGCLRVENDLAHRLLYETDTGAPVVIQE